MPADDLSSYVGKEQRATAVIEAVTADRFAATLDLDEPPRQEGDELPNAWHWLTFVSAPRRSLVSADGRGAAGELIPPFEGLNRMWAGGAFTFMRPLRIGEAVERVSRVASLTTKEGRTGKLILASVEHTLTGPSGAAVRERQDLVFREQKPYAGAAEGERPAREPRWKRTLIPDEVLLFRFSALTFNGHRIHYDWRYTTGVEGYPGLLVHGPLTCTLLLDLIRRNTPGRRLESFDYRAQRPLFCGNALTLCGASGSDGASVDVWAEDHEGFVAMRGRGVLAL